MKRVVTVFTVACLACALTGCGAYIGTSWPVGSGRVGVSVPVDPDRNRGTVILRYPTIFEAAENGHLGDVKEHLRRGAAVNARDGQQRTPLFLAAANGHYDVVRYLVNMDGDVNARNRDGASPLAAARAGGYEGVANLLADRGAVE